MTRNDNERPGRASEDGGSKGDVVQPRARQPKAKPKSGGGWDTIKTVFYAVLIAVLVRTVLIEPFSIPSRSMLPTLLVGDYLFVSKFSYGYSRHSLPFSPSLFSGRILFSAPIRGDVIVFKLPTDNSTDYIKRLIGLPGDRIQVKGGILHINGAPVERELVSNLSAPDDVAGYLRPKEYIETLPNGRRHRIWEQSDQHNLDNTPVYTVPPGHYFAMGDNRDSSLDSRVQSHVGFVPFENLVGRAEFMFFSHDSSARIWEVWKWPAAISFSRIGDGIG